MTTHLDCMADHPNWCVNCDRPKDEHGGKRCHFWPWAKAIWCQECDMHVDDEHMGDEHDECRGLQFGCSCHGTAR